MDFLSKEEIGRNIFDRFITDISKNLEVRYTGNRELTSKIIEQNEDYNPIDGFIWNGTQLASFEIKYRNKEYDTFILEYDKLKEQLNAQKSNDNWCINYINRPVNEGFYVNILDEDIYIFSINRILKEISEDNLHSGRRLLPVNNSGNSGLRYKKVYELPKELGEHYKLKDNVWKLMN